MDAIVADGHCVTRARVLGMLNNPVASSSRPKKAFASSKSSVGSYITTQLSGGIASRKLSDEAAMGGATFGAAAVGKIAVVPPSPSEAAGRPGLWLNGSGPAGRRSEERRV